MPLPPRCFQLATYGRRVLRRVLEPGEEAPIGSLVFKVKGEDTRVSVFASTTFAQLYADVGTHLAPGYGFKIVASKK